MECPLVNQLLQELSLWRSERILAHQPLPLKLRDHQKRPTLFQLCENAGAIWSVSVWFHSWHLHLAEWVSWLPCSLSKAAANGAETECLDCETSKLFSWPRHPYHWISWWAQRRRNISYFEVRDKPASDQRSQVWLANLRCSHFIWASQSLCL